MNRLCAALLVLALCSGPLWAAPPQIQWPVVEGAGGYLVEIRTGGQIVVSQTVVAHSFELTLVPGQYEMRVTTLDRYLKPGGRTEWSRFAVARAVVPTVAAVSPDAAAPGESTFVVSGSGFSTSTEVVLADSQGEIQVSSRRVLSDRELEFSATLTPGAYSVVVRNPPGQVARLPGGVTVAPLPMVRVPEGIPQPEPVLNPPKVPVRVPLSVGGGYGAVLPLGAWNAVVGPSYQDAELFALWPLWNGVGPFVRVGYSAFDSRQSSDLVSSRLRTEVIAAGASWTLAELPVRIWLAPGLTVTQAAIAGSATSSLDLSVAGGAGLVFPISDRLFWELGTDYRVVFYTGTPLQSVGLNARSGISF